MRDGHDNTIEGDALTRQRGGAAENHAPLGDAPAVRDAEDGIRGTIAEIAASIHPPSTAGFHDRSKVDPELVSQIERALADLRLLARFVAASADRRVKAGDLLAQPEPGRSDGVTPASVPYQRIALTIGKTAAEIAANPQASAELLFLLDRLSVIAFPATPDSIRLTTAYLEQPAGEPRAGRKQPASAAPPTGNQPAGSCGDVGKEAKQLHNALCANRWAMVAVFCLAIALSIYSLFGQVLMREREAIVADIDREAETFYGKPNLQVGVQDIPAGEPQRAEVRNWVAQICPAIMVPGFPEGTMYRAYRNAEYMRSCDRFEYLEAQRRQADHAVSSWVSIVTAVPDWLFGNAAAGGAPRRDYTYRPWSETVVTAMGSYILPILFGVIGAWAAGERELRQKMERFELALTDRHTYRRGLLLGGVVGGVVGMFFTADALKDLSLTYSAIALLGGFAGDRVFRFMDDLINRVFSINRPQPGATAAAPAK